MTEPRLSELLRETTRGLPLHDLVPEALLRARRVRRARRVGGVLAAAALVAAAIGVPAALRSEGVDRTRQPAPAHTGAPAPTRSIRVPQLDPAIKAAALDLHRLGSLPAASGDLPTDLTPHDASDTPPGTALMVTKERQGDQHVFYALDPAGRWHRLRVDAPADIGNGLGPMLDSTALSPDGTKVALRGADATYVVDLGDGSVRSYRSTGGTHPLWQGDSRHLLLADDAATGDVVDTRTGARTASPQTGTEAGRAFAATYSGDTLVTVVNNRGGSAFVELRSGGVAVSAGRARADAYDITDLRATSDTVVGSASPVFGRGRDCCGDIGLLVLSRKDYAGQAFLPMTPPGNLFTLLTGGLTARGWLSDHELLFSVEPPPPGTTTPPVEYYLTWNTATGQVRRVASVDQYWRDSSWATDLLG
ncbi:MAG TPA: hypothetical protein VHO29_15750 [Marmoricola sp.]|nr:hypothetical protein [Marmoricola sp.]